jgi:hypothetical protein
MKIMKINKKIPSKFYHKTPKIITTNPIKITALNSTADDEPGVVVVVVASRFSTY